MLVMFLVTLIPVFLLGAYIYRRDSDREPVKLIVKLFFGGCGAAAAAVMLYLLCPPLSILSQAAPEDGILFYAVGVFLGIALVEELFKWLFLWLISYRSPEFDQSYDAIVYGAFAGLGFAFLENLFYGIDSTAGTAISRAILTVPGHCCYGVFMGVHLARAKMARRDGRKAPALKHLFQSLAFPVLLHGSYDLFIGTDRVLPMLLGIALKVFVVVAAVKKVKAEAAANRTFTAPPEDMP